MDSAAWRTHLRSLETRASWFASNRRKEFLESLKALCTSRSRLQWESHSIISKPQSISLRINRFATWRICRNSGRIAWLKAVWEDLWGNMKRWEAGSIRGIRRRMIITWMCSTTTSILQFHRCHQSLPQCHLALIVQVLRVAWRRILMIWFIIVCSFFKVSFWIFMNWTKKFYNIFLKIHRTLWWEAFPWATTNRKIFQLIGSCRV